MFWISPVRLFWHEPKDEYRVSHKTTSTQRETTKGPEASPYLSLQSSHKKGKRPKPLVLSGVVVYRSSSAVVVLVQARRHETTSNNSRYGVGGQR